MDGQTFISSVSNLYHASKEDMVQIKLDQSLKNFRDKVFCFLVTRKNEDEYLNLDPFLRDSFFPKVLDQIRDELHFSKWKTELSFNDTGLFIFKTDKPKTCW